MPKIIVTRPDRQILAVQEIVEHPNELFEVVLEETDPRERKFLLYSTERRMYWKTRFDGYTNNIYEAHPYPYHQAVDITRTSFRTVNTVMIPAPNED